jgi:hypothetical protein
VFEEIEENYLRIFLFSRGTNECVGWSTTIIFTSRKSIVGSTKVYNQNMGSWICGLGDDQVTFKGLCILWGKKTCNHGFSLCAFSHIKVGITKHVELQNVAWTLMDQP